MDCACPTTLAFELIISPLSKLDASDAPEDAETVDQSPSRKPISASHIQQLDAARIMAVNKAVTATETIDGFVFHVSAAAVFNPKSASPPEMDNIPLRVCFLPNSFSFKLYDQHGGPYEKTMCENPDAEFYLDCTGASDLQCHKQQSLLGYITKQQRAACRDAMVVIERDSHHTIADILGDAFHLQHNGAFWDHKDHLQLPLILVAHAAEILLDAAAVLVTDTGEHSARCTAGHFSRPGAPGLADTNVEHETATHAVECCCGVLHGQECQETAHSYWHVVRKGDIGGQGQVIPLANNCRDGFKRGGKEGDVYLINKVLIGWAKHDDDTGVSWTPREVPKVDPNCPIFYGIVDVGGEVLTQPETEKAFLTGDVLDFIDKSKTVYSGRASDPAMSLGKFKKMSCAATLMAENIRKFSALTGFEDGLCWIDKLRDFKRGFLDAMGHVSLKHASLNHFVSEDHTSALYKTAFGPHDRDLAHDEGPLSGAIRCARSRLYATNWISGPLRDAAANKQRRDAIRDKVVKLLQPGAKASAHDGYQPFPSNNAEGTFLVSARLTKKDHEKVVRSGPLTIWNDTVKRRSTNRSQASQLQVKVLGHRDGTGRVDREELLPAALPTLMMFELATRETLLQDWTRSAFSWLLFFPAIPGVLKEKLPVNNIKDYLGERIAFFYAWQFQLNRMLQFIVWPGIVVIVYGAVKAVDAGADTGAVLNQMFDNELTPLFTVLVGLWSTTVLESWKRKQARLAHRWDVTEYEREEVVRAQFRPTAVSRDPITRELVLQFPYRKKMEKFFQTYSVIVISVLVLLAACTSVITTRIIMNQSTGVPVAVRLVVPALLQTFLIVALEAVYYKLSLFLNDFENHQTQTNYDDHLVIKLFSFNFVNMYAPLFYIAYVQSRVAIWGDDSYIEPCGDGETSCMKFLAMQVGTQLVVKPLIDMGRENYLPGLLHWAAGVNKMMPLNRNWLCSEINKQNSGSIGDDPMLREYNSKILQFGLVTIFAAAFPLAPLICLVMNMLDTRLDASRLLRHNKRIVSQRSQDIGSWQWILEFLSYVAVVSNAFMITFTSNFGRRLREDYGLVGPLVFLLIYEHTMMVVKGVVATMIPDEPVRIKVQRESRSKKVTMYFKRLYQLGNAAKEAKEEKDMVESQTLLSPKKNEPQTAGNVLADFTELACRSSFRRFVPDQSLAAPSLPPVLETALGHSGSEPPFQPRFLQLGSSPNRKNEPKETSI